MNGTKTLKLGVLLLTSGWLANVARAEPVTAPLTTPQDSAPANGDAVTALESPEVVAAQYMNAMRKRNWTRSAQLMHPDALKQLKQLFRPFMSTAQGREVGALLFKVRTATDYEKLTGAQLFVRLMEALMNMSPEVAAALGTAEYEIVGHVAEAPDLAHIVYRMKTKTRGISVTKAAVMSLKKSGNTWRGVLTGEIEGLAAAFAQPAAPPRPGPSRSVPTRQSPQKKTPVPQTPARRTSNARPNVKAGK